MLDIVTPIQIYPALQALLGLPEHCLSFELSARYSQPVTVICEHYVALDAGGIKQLERVFSQYELVRKPALGSNEPEFLVEQLLAGCADQEVFTVVKDFDAWMWDRTERAHREFMDRTARALPCR